MHLDSNKPCLGRQLTKAKRRLALASSSGGASLVEVMIACGVLVFALCSSFLAFNRGYEVLDTARCSSLAAQILQSEIERIRLMNWADVTNTTKLPSGSVAVGSPYSDDAWIAARFTTFQRTVTTDTSRGTADITLAISWKGYNGASYTRTFKAHYYKNGLYDFYYTRAQS